MVWVFQTSCGILALLAAVSAQNHLSKVRRPYVKDIWTSTYHPGKRSHSTLADLKKNADLGEASARAQINLLNLLGVNAEPSIKESEEVSRELSLLGVAAGHTVQGFLIRHNLTSKYSSSTEVADPRAAQEGDYFTVDSGSDTDLQQQALEHFVAAAEGGDPLAQLIVGLHYQKQQKCEAAADMYRRAAVQALGSIRESTVTMFKLGPFVNPDDGPGIHWPSEEEIEFLEFQAKSGDPDAALQAAAILLSEQLGMRYEPKRAEEYLKIAIEADISTAMVYMAHLHMDGDVSEPNLVYAQSLLEKALDLGDASAHGAYARFYLENLTGLPRNVEIAMKHLEKGVEAGHLDSMFYLGQLSATSPSTDDNFLALQYWTLPASHGHVYASWYTAEFYTKMAGPNTKVIGAGKKELSRFFCEASLSLYRSVAQAGEWHSLVFAAFNDFKEERYNAAAIKYMLLSDLGYDSAHINLGRVLQEKPLSLYTSEDEVRRQEFVAWDLAANRSIPVGFLQLGHHYYFGTGGATAKNKTKAAENYKRGSLEGNAEATFNLAYLYEWGDGVKQNIPRAFEIYMRAANVSEDAWLPSTMALTRLQLFRAINDTFSLDLYTLDYDHHSRLFKSIVCSPEFLLGVIILFLLNSRRR